MEIRLRRVVRINDEQFSFLPERSMTDGLFAKRIIMGKYRE